MIKKTVQNKNLKIILVILILGLFARVYKLTDLFGFGHEQDLQAWIVKDILIDKHPRLIGQETSVPGLFIGPFYYYMLVPFFALFKLNPLSSYILITAISLLRYGYRYLLWLNNVNQVKRGNDVPVYSIVRPFQISEADIVKRSGEIG